MLSIRSAIAAAFGRDKPDATPAPPFRVGESLADATARRLGIPAAKRRRVQNRDIHRPVNRAARRAARSNLTRAERLDTYSRRTVADRRKDATA